MADISNHPTTQSAKDTIVNGLVRVSTKMTPLATSVHLLTIILIVGTRPEMRHKHILTVNFRSRGPDCAK